MGVRQGTDDNLTVFFGALRDVRDFWPVVIESCDRSDGTSAQPSDFINILVGVTDPSLGEGIFRMMGVKKLEERCFGGI